MTYEVQEMVTVPVEGASLPGQLAIPTGAGAVVLFAHGAGSSHLSDRNRFVARALHQHGFGTLLFDLLTRMEDVDYANRFDIPLLTDRLMAATAYLDTQAVVAERPFGYFGSSTGAASALQAAAQLPRRIEAVVSRGGRADLAGTHSLRKVRAATLLIMGELDVDLLTLNQESLEELSGPKSLVVIDNATHLFEEPGTLGEVALVASRWFRHYLLPASHPKYLTKSP